MLPRLYCIVDAGHCATDAALFRFVRELLAAGATLIQYRNKQGSDRQILSHARELRRIAALPRLGGGRPATLIMNDRADLCLAAGFGGVHLGQDDLSPAAARRVIGSTRLLGLSTHNVEQLRAAAQTDCDYIAIGPVFATASKQNPAPVIGLEAVRAGRAELGKAAGKPAMTRKPLVAIGGITRANCVSVIAAGADSVAVISDLLRNPAQAVAEFLEVLGQSSSL